MAAHAVLRFHDGSLDVPEELQRDWKLSEGSELRVVASSSPGLILLEAAAPVNSTSEGALQAWHSLSGLLTGMRDDAWDATASARKAQAADELERAYASGSTAATELRRAERAWERADDDLDFGPFPER